MENLKLRTLQSLTWLVLKLMGGFSVFSIHESTFKRGNPQNRGTPKIGGFSVFSIHESTFKRGNPQNRGTPKIGGFPFLEACKKKKKEDTDSPLSHCQT